MQKTQRIFQYNFFLKDFVFFIDSMANDKLDAIPTVHIDYSGRFKYILMKVFGQEQADGVEPFKLIVRGYQRAQWHGEYLLTDFARIFLRMLNWIEFLQRIFMKKWAAQSGAWASTQSAWVVVALNIFPKRSLLKFMGIQRLVSKILQLLSRAA